MTKMRDVPNMQATLALIKPFLPLLFQALEEGTIQAKNNMEKDGHDFEPGLHASLTRSYVWSFFKKPENILPWTVNKLNNNGLQMTVGELILRTRKATSGAVPRPTTKTFDRFLKQMTLGGDFDVLHNLLILWETNQHGELQGISLIYPLSPTVEKWRYTIPHPLAAGTFKSGKKAQSMSQIGQQDLTEDVENNIVATGGKEDLLFIYQTEMLMNNLDDLEVEYVGAELQEELTDVEVELDYADQVHTGSDSRST